MMAILHTADGDITVDVKPEAEFHCNSHTDPQ